MEFYSKNKFEKLVHLVGFIIRMYHDARSPERQITAKYISVSLYTSVSCMPVILSLVWLPEYHKVYFSTRAAIRMPTVS